MTNSHCSRPTGSIEISFGHSAEHAPVFVHAPNPSDSAWETISRTRVDASTRPWGKSARCEIFDATKSVAYAFLQTATHAPHPMHAA